MKKILATTYILALFPLIAHAQTFRTFVGDVVGMIRYIIPLILGLAVVFFFWGLITFIAQRGDEEAVSKGKQRMLWGIIGIFVMVSVWGLVNFVLNTLGFIV